MKRISQNLLLITVSFIFSLLLSEGLLKIMGIGEKSSDNVMNLNSNGLIIPSDNPRLVYTFKPNQYGETNAQGFRDHKDYKIQKEPKTKRIVALGDSVAYGVVVPWDKIFLSRLEENFNNSHSSKIEILNMALSGYSTTQEVEMLKEKGLEYAPDEVWVFYVLNDPNFDGSEFAVVGKEHLLFKKQVEVFTLLGKLRNYSNIWKTLETYFFSKKVNDLITERIQEDMVKYAIKNSIKTIYHVMHFDENFKETKDSFVELKELSRRHNFKLKFIIMPVLDPMEDYKFYDIHEKVKATLNSYEIENYDLLESLKSKDLTKFRLSPNDNLHLNDKGHNIISEILENLLLK